MSEEFKCQQCGRCCIKFHEMWFTYEDWDRWKEEGRIDLLEHPCIDEKLHDICEPADIGYWTAKEFKQYLQKLAKEDGVKFLWGGYIFRCPFLKWVKKGKYKCLIHETKPTFCRLFPFKEEDGTMDIKVTGCTELNRLKVMWGIRQVFSS